MRVSLEGSWALIFGVSSGMGRATARALADEGCNVIGLHFDMAEGQKRAAELAEELRGRGVSAHFFNVNIASPEARADLVPRIGELTGDVGLRVVVHSVAFGTLLPYFPTKEGDGKTLTARQMTMTVDVMAHSLVYWTQDLHAAALLPRGAKIYAMTSSGGTRVLPSYGAVSAAKASLEAHVRQLAVELAPFGVSANAVRAGTTLTPALEKIPGSDEVVRRSEELNPHGRLTTTEDVAEAIVQLSVSDSSWITGNVLGVDGGEALVA